MWLAKGSRPRHRIRVLVVFLFFFCFKSNLCVSLSLINERFGLRERKRRLAKVLVMGVEPWNTFEMSIRLLGCCDNKSEKKKMIERAVLFFVVLLFYFVQRPASIIYVVGVG